MSATPTTDAYRSYTGLEQWLFLEVAALQEQMHTLQNQFAFQESYVEELEERMTVLEKAVLRQLHWNQDQAPILEVIQEENMTDDLERLLREFEDETEEAERRWHDILANYIDENEVEL